VLVVCVGKATRLARFLAEGDKLYRATVRLGFATATDDLLGAPLGLPRRVHLDRRAVEVAARALTGDLEQVPPAYSAKRIAGRRLYDLAREGTLVSRPPARVHVSAFDVLALRDDEVDIEVRCAPGTYVRALARDLGANLGMGGHLVALRRLMSGGFTNDDAVPGDLLPSLAHVSLKPLEALLLDLPAVRLSEAGLAAVRHGRDVTAGDLAERPTALPLPSPWWRLLGPEGDLVAIAVPRALDRSVHLNAPVLHPEVVLA